MVVASASGSLYLALRILFMVIDLVDVRNVVAKFFFGTFTVHEIRIALANKRYTLGVPRDENYARHCISIVHTFANLTVNKRSGRDFCILENLRLGSQLLHAAYVRVVFAVWLNQLGSVLADNLGQLVVIDLNFVA